MVDYEASTQNIVSNFERTNSLVGSLIENQTQDSARYDHFELNQVTVRLSVNLDYSYKCPPHAVWQPG